MILEKLLPLAYAYNLRIVSLYRRDYPSSSGFRDDVLEGIGSQKRIDEAEPFFRAQGTEIATFLAQFATEQCIPMADHKNPSVGGIALIGWPLGAMHFLALLWTSCQRIPGRRFKNTSIRHCLMMRASWCLAYPIHPKTTTVCGWRSMIASASTSFFNWVTAHFIYKSVASESINDLEFNNPSEEIPRSFRDGKLLLCDVTAFAALTKYALFDKRRAEKSPNVRVRYISGGTSAGVFTWTLWMLRKYAEDLPEELYGSDAEKARDIKVITQTEGNHFIFWEDPEKAIQQCSVAINL